jgi:hypothetical protein
MIAAVLRQLAWQRTYIIFEKARLKRGDLSASLSRKHKKLDDGAKACGHRAGLRALFAVSLLAGAPDAAQLLIGKHASAAFLSAAFERRCRVDINVAAGDRPPEKHLADDKRVRALRRSLIQLVELLRDLLPGNF